MSGPNEEGIPLLHHILRRTNISSEAKLIFSAITTYTSLPSTKQMAVDLGMDEQQVLRAFNELTTQPLVHSSSFEVRE